MELVNWDDQILLAEVPAILPTHPSMSTVRRWSREGVGGIRLATCRIGGRRTTSRLALQAFLDHLNSDPIVSQDSTAS